MSAMSHDFPIPQSHDAARKDFAVDPAMLKGQWDAVHEAAAAIGILAQLGAEPVDEALSALPDRAIAVGGARLEAVARAMDDLAAVLQSGLRALMSLSAKGRDTTSAALTLWREFHNARAAILTLAPAG